MRTTQFVPFRINDEKTAFPPFGRVDTACYPASLLGKAYYAYSLPQVSSASRPSQLVKYSGYKQNKKNKPEQVQGACPSLPGLFASKRVTEAIGEARKQLTGRQPH